MSNARTSRTPAIILRRQDVGEADCILTVLTPLRGKVRLMAKGMRKLRSRKAGHLDLFLHSDLLLAHGRNLDIITQAETIHTFRALREDLLCSTYAAYFVELLDKFTVEDEPSQLLFQLLLDSLTHLNDQHNPALVARYYELHLLTLAGFQPELNFCVVSGDEILPEAQFFDPLLGGIVSRKAVDSANRPRPIRLETLKLLRFLQRSSFGQVLAIKVSASVLSEAEQLLLLYLTTILERNLKSADFLRHLRSLSPQV